MRQIAISILLLELLAVSGCVRYLGYSDPGTSPNNKDSGSTPNRDSTALSDGQRRDGASSSSDVSTRLDGARLDGSTNDAALPQGPLQGYLAYPLPTNGFGYRRLDLTNETWSNEITVANPNTGPLYHLIVRGHSSGKTWMGVQQGSTPAIRIFELSSTGGSMSLDNVAPITSSPHRRRFDIAIERQTGLPIVVYEKSSSNPFYRRFDGNSWSAETPLFNTPPTPGHVQWVVLKSHPRTNEIGLVYADANSNVAAAVWNGSSWSAGQSIGGNLYTLGFKVVEGAYAQQSGQFFAIWGSNNNNFIFSAKDLNSDNFGTPSALPPFAVMGPLFSASEPNSDRILLLDFEVSFGTANDVLSAVIASGSWNDNDPIDTNVTANYESRLGSQPVHGGWLGTSGIAYSFFNQGPTTIVSTWQTPGPWSAQPLNLTPAPAVNNAIDFDSTTLPGATNRLLTVILDASGNLWTKLHKDSGVENLDGGAALVTGLPTTVGVPFDFDLGI